MVRVTTTSGLTRSWTLATMETWSGRESVEGIDGSVFSLQIVDVNLTSEGKVKLEPGMELPFSYQVCLHTHIQAESQPRGFLCVY